MTLGFIGLGKMGKNMVLRLLAKNYQVIAWNRSPEPRLAVQKRGAITTDTVQNLVNQFQPPRVVWLMLPAGQVTGNMIAQLSTLLSAGDTLIDGANSFYQDTIKRGEILRQKKINFLDVGVSGGPAGALNGACLMIGGDKATYLKLESLFADLAAPNAYRFFPGTGAGHFVKMVHNGIEYGMMQAIAEGFSLLKESSFNLDLIQVADIYNRHSVIQSRLIAWTKEGFEHFGPDLASVSPVIAHSGEGEWTIQTAQKLGLTLPAITAAFNFRLESKKHPSFTGKIVSMLRHQFGGHKVSQD